jgi:hypothetical protein
MGGMHSDSRTEDGDPGGGLQPRLVLVTAAHWIGARSGPGQRTRMIFRALHRVGPVHVACLGAPDPAALARAFPGAAGLHPIAGTVFGAPAGPRAALARLLRPARAYRPDPAIRAALLGLVPGGAPAVFVFRFARLFCVAGLAADAAAGRLCVVDVDDRDDQRAAAQLARLLGPAVAGAAPFRAAVARLRRLLRDRLAAASALWFVKPADRLDGLELPSEVVPNAPSGAPAAHALPPPSTASAVLFVGNGDHDSNRDGMAWFVRRVWPAVRARIPDARLRIVGIGRWAEGLGRLAQAPGVALAGAVPAVGPEYAGARVVICPLVVAAGSQLKLIEACAHGRPVVCTPAVAGGFGAAIAARLAVAAAPAALAAAVCRYLEEPAAADADGAELARLQREGFAAAAIETAIARSLRRLLAPAGRGLSPVT